MAPQQRETPVSEDYPPLHLSDEDIKRIEKEREINFNLNRCLSPELIEIYDRWSAELEQSEKDGLEDDGHHKMAEDTRARIRNIQAIMDERLDILPRGNGRYELRTIH